MSVAPTRPPDIYQVKKMSCLANIQFLFFLDPYPGWKNLAEENTLSSWRTAKKFAIEEVLSNRLDGYIAKFKLNELALRPILSLLSAMAILISKEFDACLQGVVNNDWKEFEGHCNDGHFDEIRRDLVQVKIDLEDDRLEITFRIFSNLRTAWEDSLSLVDEPPVRKITLDEKKGYLEEVGELPKTPSHLDDIYSARRRYYATHFRTHLSVDIFAPIDNIVEIITDLPLVGLQKRYSHHSVGRSGGPLTKAHRAKH